MHRVDENVFSSRLPLYLVAKDVETNVVDVPIELVILHEIGVRPFRLKAPFVQQKDTIRRPQRQDL